MRNLISSLLSNSIRDKDGLVEVLKQAAADKIIEPDCLPIIEAVINIDNLTAKDIMIPRMSMDVLDINDDLDTMINTMLKTGHSRFPVIDEEISNILGILHSKDLIQYLNHSGEFNLKDLLRQAYFVPEIKRLDGLMYEMRLHQSHMAIVVDEFTNVVGLITLEMIVEQILGEIEDEHDSVDGERAILPVNPNSYRVKGQCKLSKFNAMLNLDWSDNSIETIGGFLIKLLGRIPASQEVLDFDKIKIEVVNADSRKINLLLVTVK